MAVQLALFDNIITQHRNTQETLAVLDRLDLDTEKPSEEELAKKFGYDEQFKKGEFRTLKNS